MGDVLAAHGLAGEGGVLLADELERGVKGGSAGMAMEAWSQTARR